MKNWKPLFIEESRIPVWLSYISPISISAITLGPLVIARGKLDERLKRHETIHFQQYLETLFVGFIVLYLFDYLVGFMRYRDGEVAYYNIRAEREAYGHDKDPEYLQSRKRYAWLVSKE